MEIKNNEHFLLAKSVKFGACDPETDEILNNVFINSATLGEIKNNPMDAYTTADYFRIYVNPLIDASSFTFSLVIDDTLTAFSWTKETVDLNSYNREYSNATNMNGDDNSFMLLRVNPKISSNIKVVVDENSNLYLDAFKINTELSKRKYRKVPVSYKDYYGRNLAAYAANFPSYTYVYDVPEDYHKLFTVVSDFKNQYVDIYRYGASNNTDKLYSENFSILAPLSIGKIIPDFFAVFKVNGVVDLTESMKDSSIFKQMIKDAKLIKSFDLREESKVGTYIRTIQSNAKNDNGSLYVAYAAKQFNTYTGIALDKGVVTTKYESPYSLNYKNQVQSDNFYTLGFERNELVNDHIVNFEYMFNDDDAEMFEINTYFGLYLKMNGNDMLCCNIDGSIMEIDGDVPEGLSFEPKDDANSDLLYCVEDNDKLSRLITLVEDSSIVKSYSNRTGENILTSRLKKIHSSDDEPIYYLTIKLNNLIKPGEHFKLINKVSENQIDIYEIVFSNYDNYKNERISRTVLNTAENDSVKYNYYRISIYTDNDSTEVPAVQAADIVSALSSFIEYYDGPFAVARQNDKIVITSDKALQFERITSLPKNDVDSSVFDNDIYYFFNNNIADSSILSIADYNNSNDYYYANNFELLGDRRAYIVDFKSKSGNVYQFTPTYDSSKYEDYKYILLENKGNLIKIDNFKNCEYSIDNMDKIMIDASSEISSLCNTNFYLPYTWNFGLCSIFDIKDFDFNVIDGYSDIAMPGEEKKKVSDKNNEIDFDILSEDASTIIKTDVPSEAFTSYVSETDSVPTYAKITVVDVSIIDVSSYEVDGKDVSTKKIHVYTYDHPVELSMNRYMKFKYDRNVTSSHISLTAPYNCKWTAAGTDVINNNIKLTYNNNLLRYKPTSQSKCTLSYFIPATVDSSHNSDSNDIFSSILGLLYVPDVSAESYNKYYSSMISSSVDGSLSMRDAIYKKNLSIDNLIYSPKNYKNKYSKVYYRGNNTLEFISSGVKFNLKFSSDVVVDLEKYNGFKGIFVTASCRNLYNDSDIETFIDEMNETIAIIWHQPAYSLKYGEQNQATEYDGIYVKKIGMNADVNMIYQQKDASIVIPTYSKFDTSINKVSNITVFMTGIDLIDSSRDSNAFVGLFNNPKVSNADTSINVSKLYSRYENTKMWIDSSLYTTFTSGKLSETFNKYMKIPSRTDMSYIISTVNDLSSIRTNQTYDDLKNMVSDSVVYIKTSAGALKYYDNRTANLFSLNVIDPIEETFVRTNKTSNLEYSDAKYFVHPTYFEPKMVDILSFEYNDEDLSDIFKKNYHLSNIRIKDVDPIEQMWYNKMSADMNYCFNSNYTAFGLGIDVEQNWSVMRSVWSNRFFNKYSRDSIQDEYDRINLEGYTNFIIGESVTNSDVSLYDYLPKIPSYLVSSNIGISDVKSNIKLNKEVFNQSSYDSSILYVYNPLCDGSTSYSNCVESPNFKNS